MTTALKTFRTYVLLDPEQRLLFRHEEALNAALDKIVSTDPGPHTWATLGVVNPAPKGDGLHFRSTGDTVMLQFRLSERILPRAVINEEVDKKVKRLLADEGDERNHLTRNEMAQIKEEVVTERLPQALIKSKLIPVYLRGPYIVIGASAVKLCELILDRLRFALGSLKVVKLEAEEPFGEAIQRFAHCDEPPRDHTPYEIRPGKALQLVDGDGAKVTFKNEDLRVDHVQELLVEGYRATEIQLVATVSGHDSAEAAFQVNDSLLVKGVKVAAHLVEERHANLPDDEEGDVATMARFDANVILSADVAFSIIDSLLEHGGGRLVTDEERAAREAFIVKESAHRRWGTADTAVDEEAQEDNDEGPWYLHDTVVGTLHELDDREEVDELLAEDSDLQEITEHEFLRLSRETEASEDTGDTAEEEDGPWYLHHPESSSVWVEKDPARAEEAMRDGLVEEVSEARYEQLLEEYDEFADL